MTSHHPEFVGNGGNIVTVSGSAGEMTSSDDNAAALQVTSLAALSLNGLNERLGEAADARDSTSSMSSEQSDTMAPKLSWGDVTEIGGGGATTGSHYNKRSVDNAWQVRSTQNPSKPLVRRPTPMAIQVPKSVLGKGSSKMMAGSFDEEEEEEEEEEGGGKEEGEGSYSQAPAPQRQGTNMDVLIVEDVIGEEEEEACKESSPPDDLPVQPTEGALLSSQSNLEAGSPTIVVHTTLGKQLSTEEAEKLERDDEINDDDENSNHLEGNEADERKGVEDPEEQFLSPDKTESFKKNPLPLPSNTRTQGSPSQKKKLVRRQTPIALDVSKDIKGFDILKENAEILEEEEEDREDAHQTEEGNLRQDVLITPSIVEESEEGVATEEASATPDLSDMVNQNNNHQGESSLDVDDGVDVNDGGHRVQPDGDTRRKGFIRKAKSCDGRMRRQKLAPQDGTEAQRPVGENRLFRKSASCDKSDVRRSPLAARRKVSPHHTKILTRQQTPIDLQVPTNVLSEFKKSKSVGASVEEDEEEES